MIPSTQSILQADGTMRCLCGGTQFQAQRSTARKVAFGFASLLGSTNEVKCVACGRRYAPAVTSHQEWIDASAPPARPDI